MNFKLGAQFHPVMKSIMFTKQELKLLKQKNKIIVPPRVSDTIKETLLEMINDFDIKLFEQKLMDKTNSKIDGLNKQIANIKNKINDTINKLSEKSTIGEMLKRSINYYYTNYDNKNYSDNPILDCNFDSIHKYSSRTRRDNNHYYWGSRYDPVGEELEKVSTSSSYGYCLQDGLDLGWKVDGETYKNLCELANIYLDFGFRVLIAHIWDNGQEFEVYDLSKCDPRELDKLNPELVRFYVATE